MAAVAAVAAVAWMPDKRRKRVGNVTPHSYAPEVCADLMPPSNSWAGTHVKTGLYLQARATHVWIASLAGQRRVMCA